MADRLKDTHAISLRMSRRRAIAGGAALAFTLPFAHSSLAQARKSITSTVVGGTFQKVYDETLVKPFEAANNVDVALKIGSPNEWLASAIMNRFAPELDVLLLPYPDSIRAVKAGICEELTVAELPNLADVYPQFIDGYAKQGVGIDFISFGLIHRTDSKLAKPVSWMDLFKPEYKGKIAIPTLSISGGVQFLLTMAQLHGGSVDNIEPGFEAVKRMKPNIMRFYTSKSEGQQIMERGTAALIMGEHNVAAALIDNAVPIEFLTPAEGVMVGMISLHVVKNSKNTQAAKNFVNFTISSEANGAFNSRLIAGPTNKKVVLKPEIAARIPTYEHLLFPDWNKIVDRLPTWLERWNREIVG
ncbi:putative spermidine/putrescine transport system substrate-binding protein [Nitrobacteraceae bacterium AZCC 2146]